MAPESEQELRVPIKPLVDQGTITVTITATTQIRSDTETCEIEILVNNLKKMSAVDSTYN